MAELIQLTSNGLYCPLGDFYVDPWKPVARAVITHGHGDHARAGSGQYFCAEASRPILKQRLSAPEEILESHPYRKKIKLGEVSVSFYPAGHILGSAQILIENEFQRTVISGDYKREQDPTCEAFEVVPCDTFVTEATFALPIYKWQAPSEIANDLLKWWESNVRAKRASILFGYSLGKAQRLLAELALLVNRPVYVHGAIEPLTRLYREQGIKMLPTVLVSEQTKDKSFAGELVLAPPSAHRSPWIRRFRDYEAAFASGWMRVRAARRWGSYDRGFALSDHADWPGLLRTIQETGAKKIYVTHGSSEILVRYLRERDYDAQTLQTLFGDEAEAV